MITLSKHTATNLSHEGNQMMLAERKDLNVLHNDELIVVLVENCPVDNVEEVLLVALCEEEHGFGVALRSLEKALTVGVFAKAFEDRPHCAREFLETLLLLLVGGLFALPRSQA